MQSFLFSRSKAPRVYSSAEKKEGIFRVALSLCFSRCSRRNSSLDAQYPCPCRVLAVIIKPTCGAWHPLQKHPWALFLNNSWNIRHSSRMVDHVTILILCRRVGDAARRWGTRQNLALRHQESRTETTASHQLISVMNEIGSAFEGKYYQVEGGSSPARVQHGRTTLVAQWRGM